MRRALLRVHRRYKIHRGELDHRRSTGERGRCPRSRIEAREPHMIGDILTRYQRIECRCRRIEENQRRLLLCQRYLAGDGSATDIHRAEVQDVVVVVEEA